MQQCSSAAVRGSWPFARIADHQGPKVAHIPVLRPRNQVVSTLGNNFPGEHTTPDAASPDIYCNYNALHRKRQKTMVRIATLCSVLDTRPAPGSASRHQTIHRFNQNWTDPIYIRGGNGRTNHLLHNGVIFGLHPEPDASRPPPKLRSTTIRNNRLSPPHLKPTVAFLYKIHQPK